MRGVADEDVELTELRHRRGVRPHVQDHRAGRDAVHPDAALRQHLREGFRQGVNRAAALTKRK